MTCSKAGILFCWLAKVLWYVLPATQIPLDAYMGFRKNSLFVALSAPNIQSCGSKGTRLIDGKYRRGQKMEGRGFGPDVCSILEWHLSQQAERRRPSLARSRKYA